jgi:predicted permease
MRSIVALVSPAKFGPNLLVVLLLGFGLGSAALLHTALDRLLLHPLRIANAERLVRAGERHPPVTSWSWFPFTTYQRAQKMQALDALAVEGEVETTITEKGIVKPAIGDMVSADYFSMLDGRAELGRALTQADETEVTVVPLVLSHRLWMQEFNGVQGAVGTTLHLQGKPFTVVGVMPPQFFGTRLDASPDFWIPLAAQALLSKKSLTDPNADRNFSIIGHLRDGATPAQAQAEFAELFRETRESGDLESEGFMAPIAEGSFALREQFSRALGLLQWGLAAMLAMVCASIAGMLMARAARDARATAVRMALGASHLRLAASALLESIWLGLAGAGCGLGFAFLCGPLLAHLLPQGQTPLPVTLQPDMQTAGLIVALALGVSILFGTIPAWITTRVAPQMALRGGTATRRAGLMSRGLMIFETSATLVLLVGTGLLLRTLSALHHSDPGFDVEHVVTFTLNPALPAGDSKARPFLPMQLGDQVSQLGGVTGVGFSEASLMHRIGIKTTVALPGQRVMPEAFLNTSLNEVSPGFFEALGISLVGGRWLQQPDAVHASPTPTIVNQAFVRTFFRGENPLGRTFGTGARREIAKASNLVVGVVGDSKYRSLREALLPIFYVPMTQEGATNSELYLYVRTTGRPGAMINSVREKLLQLEPQLPIVRVQTMREQVDDSLWQERLMVVLAAIFSIVSVLLAALGLYGLLSYDANQRTREFGIRTALGASRINVGRLMIQELAWLVLPGLVLGGAGGLLLAKLLTPMLYGIGRYDFEAWAGAVLVVLAIGTAAASHPVSKAMTADPSSVLREE